MLPHYFNIFIETYPIKEVLGNLTILMSKHFSSNSITAILLVDMFEQRCQPSITFMLRNTKYEGDYMNYTINQRLNGKNLRSMKCMYNNFVPLQIISEKIS